MVKVWIVPRTCAKCSYYRESKSRQCEDYPSSKEITPYCIRIQNILIKVYEENIDYHPKKYNHYLVIYNHSAEEVRARIALLKLQFGAYHLKTLIREYKNG